MNELKYHELKLVELIELIEGVNKELSTVRQWHAETHILNKEHIIWN